MAVKVEKKVIADNTITLTIKVPAADTIEQTKHAYLTLAYQNQIPPSRDKSPKELVDEKLSEPIAMKLVEGIVKNSVVPYAMADQNLATVGLPSFPPSMPFQLGRDFVFDVALVLLPRFGLTSYDPVTITSNPVVVTDEEVDARMAEIAKTYATEEPDMSRDTVRKGDTVDITLHTTKDGEEVKGLCFEHRPYEVSSAQMPDDFDAEIMEMKVGETKTFTFQGPADHLDENDQLIMEPYEATATLNHVDRTVIPAVTDAWVKANILGCADAEAFKEQTRRELASQKEMQDRHYRNYLAATELAKRVDGKIPDEVYEAENREVQQEIDRNAQQQGMTRAQLMEQQGMDEQTFNMMSMLQVRERLTQMIAMDALARHLKLTVDEKDLNEFFKSSAPGNEARMRQQFEQTGQMYLAYEGALRLKANDWLTAHATIREPGQDDSETKDAPAGQADADKDVSVAEDSKPEE